MEVLLPHNLILTELVLTDCLFPSENEADGARMDRGQRRSRYAMHGL